MLTAAPQRPRLAYIISTLDAGGAEAQLVNTVNALPDDVDAVVFVLRDQLALLQKLENARVRIEVIGLRARWDLLGWIRLARELRSFRPRVIHSHMLLSNWAARAMAPLCGRPRVINHEHGLSKWKGLFVNRVDRATQSLADRILVVSRASRATRIADAGLDPNRVTVLPNAIDWTRFSQVRREPDEFPGTTWGIAARLTWVKRIDLAMELLGLCLANGDNVRLLIAGDGPDRAKLKAAAVRLGVDHAVRFLGHVHDMASFYKRVDMVMLTSSSEDCPMAVLESLATGRFLATTPVGGVPELIRGLHDVQVIDEHDLPATAKALARVPKGFDSSANRAAAERFDVNAHVRQLLDIYGISA
ncbi:MAG TPA: glycosyltransferase [Polyangiaceae bacterium]|nr:glycosyltransferase [Polyangiaceae bacterium]